MMKPRDRYLALVAVLILPALGQSPVLAIDDNPGTLDRPFRTVQKGIDALRDPGDTLYIRGGSYRTGVMPDVFDPRWAENLDRKCKELCAPRKNDKQLLGYFRDMMAALVGGFETGDLSNWDTQIPAGAAAYAAMSHGALSAEAHEVLAIAMNRIGGK
mgnify:CR=1 FL=1